MKRFLIILSLCLSFTCRSQTTNGPLNLSIASFTYQYTSNFNRIVVGLSNALPNASYPILITFPRGLTNVDNWIPYKNAVNPGTNDYFELTNFTGTNFTTRLYLSGTIGGSSLVGDIPEYIQDELDAESDLLLALQDPDSPESQWLADHTPSEESQSMSRNMAMQVENLIDRATAAWSSIPDSLLTNLVPTNAIPVIRP